MNDKKDLPRSNGDVDEFLSKLRTHADPRSAHWSPTEFIMHGDAKRDMFLHKDPTKLLKLETMQTVSEVLGLDFTENMGALDTIAESIHKAYTRSGEQSS